MDAIAHPQDYRCRAPSAQAQRPKRQRDSDRAQQKNVQREKRFQDRPKRAEPGNKRTNRAQHNRKYQQGHHRRQRRNQPPLPPWRKSLRAVAQRYIGAQRRVRTIARGVRALSSPARRRSPKYAAMHRAHHSTTLR